jgi:hypothetical protein
MFNHFILVLNEQLGDNSVSSELHNSTKFLTLTHSIGAVDIFKIACRYAVSSTPNLGFYGCVFWGLTPCSLVDVVSHSQLYGGRRICCEPSFFVSMRCARALSDVSHVGGYKTEWDVLKYWHYMQKSPLFILEKYQLHCITHNQLQAAPCRPGVHAGKLGLHPIGRNRTENLKHCGSP